MGWTKAVALERLQADGRATIRAGGRQFAVFAQGDRILACNNHCPHEGYPLAEGTLDDGCVLTCNWHNWKFDLASGDNLTGGDRLRVYATRVVDGEVWIDIADPPATERRAAALANLREAFEDHAYDRLARELARLAKAGGDPLEALRQAIAWTHDRLEFGSTHAFAAMEAWLRLHDSMTGAGDRLACLVEAVGHCSWDALREPVRSFGTGVAPYTPDGFLAAIEAQDERAAIARLRDALASGLGAADLAEVLSRAALAHYQDFGHSLIYVVHAERLVARLGREVEAPLLLALVRSLVNASREDLIPEFRAYGKALAEWPGGDGGRTEIPADDLLGTGPRDTLARTLDAAKSSSPAALYRGLLQANALNLLRFDLVHQDRIDNAVADNVGWLDVTHGITFANAVRRQCARFPALWPQGLLQMACFAGRNRPYTDAAIAIADWLPPDRTAFLASCRARLLDHGERDYIHSVHFLKTSLAVEEEVAADPSAPSVEPLLAGLNRFWRSPLKRKHVARTARQALAFVAREA